jgi:hypothetical protein
MGMLERQLLWATIDASRRRSQRAQPSGKLAVFAYTELLLNYSWSHACAGLLTCGLPHAGHGGGSLQTLRGGPDGTDFSGLAAFLSESGTPDWVSEFRYAAATPVSLSDNCTPCGVAHC